MWVPPVVPNPEPTLRLTVCADVASVLPEGLLEMLRFEPSNTIIRFLHISFSISVGVYLHILLHLRGLPSTVFPSFVVVVSPNV